MVTTVTNPSAAFAIQEPAGSAIMSAPKRGGAATQVGKAGAGPVRGLVAGGGYVFWLDDTELVRQRVGVHQAPVIHRSAEKRFSPAMAANGSHVFWLSQRDREFSEAMTTPYRLMRLPR